MTSHARSAIKIDAAQLKCVREYSQLTGVSISRCLEEALDDFITIVIPSRLEALNRTKRVITKVIPLLPIPSPTQPATIIGGIQ